MKSRAVKWIFLCIGLAAVCLIVTGAGLAIRYISGGVNPFREIKMAAVGEVLEINEHPEADGKTCRRLLIDAIDHGTQFRGPANKAGNQPNTNWPRVPTSYYHTDGPIGMAFSKLNWFPTKDPAWEADDARLPASLVASSACMASIGSWDVLGAVWSEPPVGVVMLNNGTLAAYARPLQIFDFYERNPAVVKHSVAKGNEPLSFTYVDDAKKRGAHVRIIEGNERATFAKDAPKGFYHLLVVDTSRGHPGLPTKELLTREAWQIYLDALAENGIVCVHTSSRDFDLSGIIASTTGDAGLAHLRIHDGASDRNLGHYTSDWMFVARKQAMLEYLQEAAIRRKQMNVGKMPHEAVDFGQVPSQATLIWMDAGANSLSGVRR
jgi:hypothetical protein